MRTQTELASALSAAREQTDELFRLIRPNSLYERPIPERHRIVFYLGHLEAFDWNLIGRYALDIRSFNPNSTVFSRSVSIRLPDNSRAISLRTGRLSPKSSVTICALATRSMI